MMHMLTVTYVMKNVVFPDPKTAVDLPASLGHRGQSWARAAHHPDTKLSEDAGDKVSRSASENAPRPQ
jgi:hypothetical protein